MTFSLDPNLTIHEHNSEIESDQVFEECIVITNTELINEMEIHKIDLNKDDSASDDDKNNHSDI